MMIKTRSLISRLFHGMAMVGLFVTGFQGNAKGMFAVPVLDRTVQKGIQPLAADGASFYYYADGQRIPLQPSLNWVSVKFASSDISKQSSAVRSSATPLGSLDQARHIPNPELTLLPIQAGTTVQTLVQGINAMRAMPTSFQAVNPVFQMEDVEMVPTDQFIATFQAEKSLEEINAMNASLGAEIVEPLLGQENTFVLKVLPDAGCRA